MDKLKRTTLVARILDGVLSVFCLIFGWVLTSIAIRQWLVIDSHYELLESGTWAGGTYQISTTTPPFEMVMAFVIFLSMGVSFVVVGLWTLVFGWKKEKVN